MVELDDTDMKLMPLHVRNKAQKAEEQDAAVTAAAEERQRLIEASMQSDDTAPATQSGTQPTQSAPAAEAQPGNQRTETAGADDVAALKAKVKELELQLTDADNRLKTHYGRQRKLAEDKNAEAAMYKAEIETLRTQIKEASPKADGDDAVLLANGWTQDELDDASEREKSRAAKTFRKVEAERRALEERISSIDKRVTTTTGNERLNAMDTAINTMFPGFLSAIKRDGRFDMEWSMFASEDNPDSSENLTYGESFNQARKLGNRDGALRIVALFAKKHPRLSLKAEDGASEGSVDIPPLRMMPSSGPAPQVAGTMSQNAAEPRKASYARSYVMAFHKQAAKRNECFSPFTVELGNGRTKTFSTKDAMLRERDALDTAADEGRVLRD
jgi:hypothetical protein